MPLPRIESSESRTEPEEGLKDLIYRFYDELCTYTELNDLAGQFIFLRANQLCLDEGSYVKSISDEWSLSLDASFRGHCARVHLGTFFCVNAIGTEGGIDPDVRAKYRLKKEEDSEMAGFYFMPERGYNRGTVHGAQTLHYAIAITGSDEYHKPTRERVASHLSGSFFDALENNRRDQRAKAMRDFTGFFAGGGGGKHTTESDLEREADREAAALERKRRKSEQPI